MKHSVNELAGLHVVLQGLRLARTFLSGISWCMWGLGVQGLGLRV